MKLGVGPYLNMPKETCEEHGANRGPSSVRFSSQIFVQIRVLAFSGVLPYFGQIGVFLDWDRAIVEFAGAVWVLETLNIALVGANVDEKPNFS